MVLQFLGTCNSFSSTISNLNRWQIISLMAHFTKKLLTRWLLIIAVWTFIIVIDVINKNRENLEPVLKTGFQF